MNSKEIYGRLTEITSDYNFIYIISYLMLTDFCEPVDKSDKRSSYEKLSYNEAALLIGLWVKNCSQTPSREINFEKESQEVYEILETLHYQFIPKNLGKKMLANGDDIMLNPDSMKEAIFYASTGAYDYQYVNKSLNKYKNDREWILYNHNTSIEQLKETFLRIKELINQRLNSIQFMSQIKKDPTKIILIWKFTSSQLCSNTVKIENLNNFIINLYENSNATFNEIGDFNQFKIKPIVKLDSDVYFIPQAFFLAESIYESPFYWMLEDKEYKDIALKNRGEIGEEITHDHLAKVFGKENCYNNVLIKENKQTTFSEIDTLAIHRNNVFIFQVKSKKLTSLSKKGNIDSIKSDFKKAVEHAFEQGIDAIKAIEKQSEFDFICNGKNINSIFKNIKKSYVISVLLDPYPALSHKTNLILYEKFKESGISFSIFDLEVVCAYLNNADRLAKYLISRIENCRYYVSENELCFLGYYIRNGLKPLKNYNGGLIANDYGTEIDRDYYPKIGNVNRVYTEKIGRNEKCPCGSGLKYKRCHGKKN